MKVSEQAAAIIRSLLRDLRVQDHLVFPKAAVKQPCIRASQVLDDLDNMAAREGSDLAIAIGEDAFRAGFEAGRIAHTFPGPDDAGSAWDAYTPPEELTGRNF